MKCTLINDGEQVNPLYLQNPDDPNIVQILVIPAGTEIDHPDAWRLCAIGTAVPSDDECRNATLAFLGNPKRLELIEKIRSLIRADGVQELDAKSKKWLEFMKKSYAKELGLQDAVTPADVE